MNFPASYAVPGGGQAFAKFLSEWINMKKSRGRIGLPGEYWIYGKGVEAGKRRWSIKKDVLGLG